MTASISNSRTFNRRSFVKTSGALLAASGTLGLVSGCATMGRGPNVVAIYSISHFLMIPSLIPFPYL